MLRILTLSFWWEDRVFTSFRDLKFQGLFSWDFDRFTSLWVASHSGFSVNDFQFANSWQCEGIFGVFVSKGGEMI